MMTENALAKLTFATTALAEARTLDEVKQIVDIAEAARTYARAARLGLEAQNHAAEIKLRAERKAGELLREMPKATGGRPTGKTTDIVSVVSAPSLADLGISHKQSSRWQAVASVPDPVFEQHLAETRSAGKELTTASIIDVAKRQRKQERTNLSSDLPPHGELYTILHGDFRTADVDDECADWIITDPPYPAQYLPLYSDLSCFAARVLKPGGSLIVMSGQSYLPEIINRLSEHMDYHWCLSYLTPGGQAPHLFQKNVNTFWKPLLWFVKGKYEGHCIGDVCKSKPNDNDKQHHHWGQSESGMADIVERFTLPGQTIIDPFLGGGTTGVVATQLKRFFIGIDIDKSAVQESMFRLSQEN